MSLKIYEEKLPSPLSKLELEEYFKKYQNGDQSAWKLLIMHNIRLVFYEVNKKFYDTGYERDDLISVGIIGLVKAVKSFCLSKNVPFSSYATQCIDNEILMFIRYSHRRQICYDSLNKVLSIDYDGNTLKLEDIISDNRDFVLDYMNQSVYKIIREIVEELPEKERIVVQMHFGLLDNNPLTQAEVGRHLNYSKSYIGRIVSHALDMIYKKLVEQGILDNTMKTRKKRLNK